MMVGTAMRKMTGFAMALVLAFGMCIPTTAAHAADEMTAASAEADAQAADATTAGELAAGELAAYTQAADNTITFSDDGIATSGSTGVKVAGTALTINAGGTYVITGSCAEGSVKVKKGTTGVTLVLRDLSLACSTAAPIAVNKDNGDTVVQVVGTVTLTDNENAADEDSADEAVADAFEGAALKVKSGSNLAIRGTGTLVADGSACKNGIKGGEGVALTIGEGATDTLQVIAKAANNGIASDGSVTVNGGTVTVTAGNDGIKSDPDEGDTTSAGTVAINGGTVIVSSGDDGIKAYYDLTIGAADATSVDGVTGADGPTITIEKSNEGIEGANVTVNSGVIDITASDDGVNAANSNLSGYDFQLTINGGTMHVNAEGDGLDSNGDITMNGGIVEVFGSSNDGNAAMDYGDNGNSWTQNGGTIIAIGMSGMAVVPTSGTYVSFGAAGRGGMGGMQPGGMGGMGSGRQDGMTGGPQRSDAGGFASGGFDSSGFTSGSSVSIAKGSAIEIVDTSGATLYSTTGLKSANSVVFSSGDLTSGSTYALHVNGAEAASATATTGNGQPGGQPGQPGQPEQPGQPGQPGQPSDQPGQKGQQPDLPGQQPGQEQQPSQQPEPPADQQQTDQKPAADSSIAANADENAATPAVEKKANTMTVTTVKKRVSAAKAAVAAKKLKALRVANAKGTVTYTRVSGSRYLKVNAKGRIVVAQGTPAGTYKVKVKIRAAGTDAYKAKAVTKVVKVVVK